MIADCVDISNEHLCVSYPSAAWAWSAINTRLFSLKLRSTSACLGSGIPAAAAEPAKDDSVAAMERFAAQAAAREQEKADKEAVVPLLNETSFDRRRVMAVFKDDGTRGHHMQVWSCDKVRTSAHFMHRTSCYFHA